MRVTVRLLLILGGLTLLFYTLGRFHSDARQVDADNSKRIRFQVTTVEEKARQRNVISEALIEGPPGTDFKVALHGGQYNMDAYFLTDLEDQDSLKVRARLNTRRLYGYSERELPLYEEDAQSHSLQLNFDESIVLLPFGRKGGDDKLKIEITPLKTGDPVDLPSGKRRPLEINIIKQSPGGIISYEAFKKPHRFIAEVSLLESGQAVATGTATLLLQDEQEVILQLTPQAEESLKMKPVAIKLAIEDFLRDRAANEIILNYSVFRLAKQDGDKREPIVLKGAGYINLDADFFYDLSQSDLNTTGKEYQLKFRFKLAPGERAD